MSADSHVKPTLTLNITLLFAPLAALQAADGSGSLRPSNLRCEYQTNPQGMDVLQPRLSWVLQPRDPAARGLRQTAYQIQVASPPPLNPPHKSFYLTNPSYHRSTFAELDGHNFRATCNVSLRPPKRSRSLRPHFRG